MFIKVLSIKEFLVLQDIIVSISWFQFNAPIPAHINTSDDISENNACISRRIAAIIPVVFSKIIEWGSKKTVDETYKQFMQREKGLTETALKELSLNSDDLRKLESKTCDNVDVSFLFKLLPLICDDIERYDQKTWSTGDENKLECLLEKLWIILHSVMSEPRTVDASPDTKDEVLKILLKILDVAGTKYSVTSEAIVKAVKEFLRRIHDILASVYSEEEINYWEIRFFLSQAPPKSLYSRKEPSPNYVAPLQLTLGSTKLKSTNLLQHISNETHNFFLIEGDRGTGKSFLLAETYTNALSSRTVLGSNAFDVAIFLKCNETFSETLADFIKDHFMETDLIKKGYLNKINSPSADDIIRALKQMKLLFLIDGFDEANESCLALLKEVVKLVKQNESAKCLVSSRHYSSSEQESFFSLFGVRPQILQISKISSHKDQISFLKESCIDGEKASETYATLGLNLEKPSQLALFARLHAKNAEEVKSLANDVQMMKDIIRDDKEKVFQRLKNTMVKNAGIVANKILTEVKEISFFCLLQKFNKIGGEFLEAFDQSIFDKFSDACRSLQVIEIMSGFFDIEATELSLSYKFYNSSHLEALAGMHFIQELMDGNKSIDEVIESSNVKYGRFRGKTKNLFWKDTSHLKM